MADTLSFALSRAMFVFFYKQLQKLGSSRIAFGKMTWKNGTHTHTDPDIHTEKRRHIETQRDTEREIREHAPASKHIPRAIHFHQPHSHSLTHFARLPPAQFNPNSIQSNSNIHNIQLHSLTHSLIHSIYPNAVQIRQLSI